ncbi:hypothetical protein HNP49_003198 [Pseudomonas fluvialis]|uniref:Uncharacterized protein n=1 Tax=Pseudomonas fluvialis TaxID=1793966 RepID=A0A7X0EVN8_9PSED|nr:hypothetical protein [Pseudomonas fluvialis]MBB6343010.1 hypothetical protein [Pseudomonas fluvialis]
MNTKQASKWILEKFAYGVVFGLGLYSAVAGTEWATKYFKRTVFSEKYFQYDGGPDLEITEHADIREMRDYIVGGKVKNNTKDTWEKVSIEVSVFKSGILADKCRDEIWLISPGTTESFSITCEKILPERLTKEYTYTVKITYANRRV